MGLLYGTLWHPLWVYTCVAAQLQPTLEPTCWRSSGLPALGSNCKSASNQLCEPLGRTTGSHCLMTHMVYQAHEPVGAGHRMH